ncbi:hypothetical protein SAMN04487843_101432 [Methylobacterium sp. ap11]|nr:hypothetical protein SAMN04487843_101432 [Methylobacterium sp. ap11]
MAGDDARWSGMGSSFDRELPAHRPLWSSLGEHLRPVSSPSRSPPSKDPARPKPPAIAVSYRAVIKALKAACAEVEAALEARPTTRRQLRAGPGMSSRHYAGSTTTFVFTGVWLYRWIMSWLSRPTQPLVMPEPIESGSLLA